jgi:hypothetical protein
MHTQTLRDENVPAAPSPERPSQDPHDPVQPDPQAAGRGFSNRRDWRGYLLATQKSGDADEASAGSIRAPGIHPVGQRRWLAGAGDFSFEPSITVR